MVHVTDLLGCLANGPTTEAALEATPGEIRRFLRFLKEHGEKVDPDAKFTTRIAAHVMEGSWIGYGDPAPGFALDFEPLSKEDQELYRRWFNWLGEDIVALAAKLSPKELDRKPAKGRKIRDIFGHIANPEPEYARAAGFGKAEGVKEVLRAIEESGDDLPGKLAELWRLMDGLVARIGEKERTQQIQRGEKLWTARRGFRRMLEHPWEHLREIEHRLA